MDAATGAQHDNGDICRATNVLDDVKKNIKKPVIPRELRTKCGRKSRNPEKVWPLRLKRRVT